ncbi:MAG: ABC transporter permease [Synechococcales bacterium]|nr:ABC transporter permease [Synechococcales bacterium]
MLRLITKADYLLRETLLGLKRGGWMNWAAISTVTVLLFLFGISLQASWQVDQLLHQFGSQLEISVYLEPGAQATALKPTVEAMSSVTEVAAISKDEAWATLMRDMGIADPEEATRQLNGNPLVDELQVKASHSDIVPQLAEELARLQGVDDVQYVDEAVQRIAQLNRGLNWISLTVTSLLTITAIAVITTTIRLIVMARQREIEVMQLVGATTTWIYFPFILQGIIFGVAGAFLAWSLIVGVQQFISQLLAQQPDFIQFLAGGLALSPVKTLLLPVVLVGLGSSVGLMGSLFAVRRFAAH